MPLHRWLIGACLGLMAVTGCKDEEEPPPPPPVLGDGTIGNIKSVAHDGATFSSPLDATPNPDGSQVYFTARGTDGAGVFKTSLSGGSVSALHVGSPIAAPVGIAVSTDDKTIFVADPAATVGEDDRGGIWSVPTAGGAPSLVPGTAGYSPSGIVLVNENGADKLYFTGKQPTDGAPGVFRITAAGGSVEGIAKNQPFNDPSGITVTLHGDIYVLDSAAGDLGGNSARIISVIGQAAKVFQSGFKVGFPAGITASQDGSALIVSSLDATTGTDILARVAIASKEHKRFSDSINTYSEPAGIHRAADAEVYAWAESTADGSGTVYVLTK
ncbi:hypothetical protein [Hyalangium versicolor]|uniref:hypothetical protein n=1 Tax=Hyalangium versicolor TaxID=2861190 RepID=UPI001CC9C8C5|nr:hypothetical protein [Hyalangium versicolor]